MINRDAMTVAMSRIIKSHGVDAVALPCVELVERYLENLPKPQTPYEQAKLYRQMTGMADE